MYSNKNNIGSLVILVAMTASVIVKILTLLILNFHFDCWGLGQFRFRKYPISLFIS